MAHRGMAESQSFNRRELLRAVGAGTAVAGGLLLGVPVAGDETRGEPETNLADLLKTPRGPHAIPGPFPGRVARVTDPRSLRGSELDPVVVRAMFRRGLKALTGESPKQAFRRFFVPADVVGIKVNPVGPPLISTHPEVVAAVVEWLREGGVPAANIVIFDRFDDSLADAGFTRERFPGVEITSLQTLATGDRSFRDAAGNHVSAGNFDPEVFYLARGVLGKGVRGYPNDEDYLNQHVFAGERSFYGTLLTRRLTKLVNVAPFKNTGNGVSMATKNLGYGVICNTGRLHEPLFFRVCTEVLAASCVRDKLVLNVLDGVRGQYEGGPMLSEQHVFPNHTLYLATDPFALDMVGHREIVARRRAEGIRVNEHPRFTDYLHQAERLGLGAVSEARLRVVRA